MLATENSRPKLLTVFVAAALMVGAGCTPSGSRALLAGDELLREGKAAQAVEKLTQATRLLPGEPRAWNLLGLAYHRSGQPQLAAQAYRQALAKDRSNRVAVAHFNLGCLLLEQNNPAAAADELRSFTLTTNSTAGLIKLASAQMRLRQLDPAERSFNAALRLEPKSLEALNGIGVIHAQKNQRDAVQYFNSALQSNPKYAPALLNSALLAQQNPSTRAMALQRFQQYLAVSAGTSQAEAVKLLVRQLETELAPRPIPPSNAIANAALKTNALLAALQSSNAVAVPHAASRSITNDRPSTTAPKTNLSAPVLKTNQTLTVATSPSPVTNPTAIALVTVTNQPPPRPAVAADPEPVPKPATELPSIATTPKTPEPLTPPLEDPKKPGLLTRLNPFRGKPKANETNNLPRVAVLSAEPDLAPNPPAQPTFPHYIYLSPAPPRAGNRANAERAMAQALKAQRAGNTNEALLNYQLATSADPSFFDAQYNSALFALQAGDLGRSLAGCEMALAIEPDSINARYNFALALKQANYTRDAVNELQRILEAKPNEPRAHLTLGNLFAQQLNDPAKARVHYVKVLELEPRNSQAAAIRFWLAANP